MLLAHSGGWPIWAGDDSLGAFTCLGKVFISPHYVRVRSLRSANAHFFLQACLREEGPAAGALLLSQAPHVTESGLHGLP